MRGQRGHWRPRAPPANLSAMFVLKLRRLTDLLLIVALAAGLVVHGVQAANMAAKMSMVAASTMPMSGECDGCCDDGCISLGGCSLICRTVLALHVVSPVFQLLPATLGEFGAIPARVGWNALPDPYPPRPTILS